MLDQDPEAIAIFGKPPASSISPAGRNRAGNIGQCAELEFSRFSRAELRLGRSRTTLFVGTEVATSETIFRASRGRIRTPRNIAVKFGTMGAIPRFPYDSHGNFPGFLRSFPGLSAFSER